MQSHHTHYETLGHLNPGYLSLELETSAFWLCYSREPFSLRALHPAPRIVERLEL